MLSLKEKTLKERYLRGDETTEFDVYGRVADFLGDTVQERGEFYKVMAAHQFMPNTPTLSNAGVEHSSGQLFACFVLDMQDTMTGIFQTLHDMAIIQKTGGGTGYCFSKLRPNNAPVNSTMGVASGPISFMKAYDAATDTIKQGGVRRGANMGCMHIWHPDIKEFITCKNDNNALNNFNISVHVTRKFMDAVKNDETFTLSFGGVDYGEVRARDLWDKLCYQAWKNGEPGVLFIDEINDKHMLYLTISATNPCGEQPLLEGEACVLGSVNLSAFVNNGIFDFIEYERVLRVATRFLNKCIDKNEYPLDYIKKVVKDNRKIGVGIMGYADMLIKLGLVYGSPKAMEFTERVADLYNLVTVDESHKLAMKFGPFNNIGLSKWKFSMRNATTTTIAPTGTISILSECSGGIEPIFAPYYKTLRLGTEFIEYHSLFKEMLIEKGLLEEFEASEDKDLKRICPELAELFISAHDITPEDHVRVQALWQKYTHNAISKTVNLPNHATVEDVKNVYMLAYELGCKGVTVYRDGSREGVLLTTEKKVVEDVVPVQKEMVKWNCPECGSDNLGYTQGCNFCKDCGYTKCS